MKVISYSNDGKRAEIVVAGVTKHVVQHEGRFYKDSEDKFYELPEN